MLCVWNDKYVVKVYRHMEMLGIANVKVMIGKQAVWRDLPGTLQSRESWFEVVTICYTNKSWKQILNLWPQNQFFLLISSAGLYT